MENSVQKPLILGNFYNGEGEMAWAWWLEEHGLLSIVGDLHLSPRKKIVAEITELMGRRDPNSVFTITNQPPQLGEPANIKAILWVEDFPDPPEFFNDRQFYIDNRHFFSSFYFNLIAKIQGIPRSQLLPPISFKPHIEGPLIGYKRAIEALSDDVPYKQDMINYLSGLTDVPWVSVKDQGRKYFIDPNQSLYEQALSFLRAAWSFWAYTCQTEEPQQMLLVIEIPKELLRKGIDPLIEKVIFQAISILKYVSAVTTTSIILSSEMLYPAPELAFRYKLLFQTADADLDFTNEGIKNMVDPALLHEWERGNKNVGIWMDDFAIDENDRQILVRIGDFPPFFWDDFVLS
ncbi:hypothetical protein EHV15_35500 [Paenibacillus oralis]|uniref:Uncharacterized protein n=1 Tax=Paenibacillus oralis TaxID=2490856 RepID=A0A3P3TAF8_9BACL|nr:hypothetical protein [Paenibacillus oralis]RRJ54882.1 hypothetical protein EHV15_35500 [Paenibacillus oralis]